jgi:hypothetical protein
MLEFLKMNKYLIITIASSVALILVFLLAYLLFQNIKKEEINANTPDWMRVVIFEEEKRSKARVTEIEKCNYKEEEVYLVSVSNLSTSVYDSDGVIKCRINNKDLSNQCIELKNKINCIKLL